MDFCYTIYWTNRVFRAKVVNLHCSNVILLKQMQIVCYSWRDEMNVLFSYIWNMISAKNWLMFLLWNLTKYIVFVCIKFNKCSNIHYRIFRLNRIIHVNWMIAILCMKTKLLIYMINMINYSFVQNEITFWIFTAWNTAGTLLNNAKIYKPF